VWTELLSPFVGSPRRGRVDVFLDFYFLSSLGGGVTVGDGGGLELNSPLEGW